jgi:hypothetical protein
MGLADSAQREIRSVGLALDGWAAIIQPSPARTAKRQTTGHTFNRLLSLRITLLSSRLREPYCSLRRIIRSQPSTLDPLSLVLFCQ